MNNKVDWYGLISSYCIFAFIYSAVIWIVWQFLFAPLFDLSFSYLQILGGYTISRILFGNTNTNYISNFYGSKTPDLNKIDTYLKEFKEELDKEAEEIEKQYQDLDKKD